MRATRQALPIRTLGWTLCWALVTGCAATTPGGPGATGPAEPPSPAPPAETAAPSDLEIRPEAPAEYDFLVGRQHELAGQLEAATAAYSRAVEKDPDSAYLRRKVAALAWREGDLESAQAHAERAYELDPADPDGRVFLGQIYRMRKQTDQAEAVLRSDEGQPVNRDAALLLYGLYLDGERLDEALQVAYWMVAEDPGNLRAYFALSRAYEELGRPEDAVRALRDGLGHDPGNLQIYAALARLYRERKDRDSEVAVYHEVLLEYPHHHGTLVALGDSLIQQGRTEEAREVLEEIIRFHPQDARSAIRLALIEFDAEEYDLAAGRFEAALAANPEDHEVAYFLGVLRQRMGAIDLALQAFERIPSHHGRYADARTQIAAVFEKRGDYARALEQARIAQREAPSRTIELYVARLRAKTGDLEGAVAMLEVRLEEAPEDDELLYNIGVLYGEAKQFDEALRYMQLALDVNPENASALNYIGYTWAERGENLDEAEGLIQRALVIRPDDGYITDSLAWVYYMRAVPLMRDGATAEGKALLHDALRKLERAAQLTGGDPVISEHLGDVYLLLDQKERALESYRDALSQDPREDEQPDLKSKFESLKRDLEGQ